MDRNSARYPHQNICLNAFKENARVLSRRTMDDPETNELDAEKHNAITSYGTNSTVFKYYKKLVNRERKTCNERYYESRIQHLKNKHKKMAGRNEASEWSKD